MYEVEMSEMSESFFHCWKSANQHLHKQVDGGIQSWLRVHPNPPFLEHLSFRLGNQLFFVRVEDVDQQVMGPGSLSGLIAVAKQANGHACILPMRKKFFGQSWEAVEPGWGLLNAVTKKRIDPIALITDEPIAMSSWEMHDFAVQMVRDYLAKEGFEITSWHGNPLIHPAIWFIGSSKCLEWVLVRSATFPSTTADRPKNWAAIAKSLAHMSEIGHFASVVIISVNQSFESMNDAPTPLWRGHGMYVRFTGLE